MIDDNEEVTELLIMLIIMIDDHVSDVLAVCCCNVSSGLALAACPSCRRVSLFFGAAPPGDSVQCAAAPLPRRCSKDSLYSFRVKEETQMPS